MSIVFTKTVPPAKGIHQGTYSWIDLVRSSTTGAKRYRLKRCSLMQTNSDRKFKLVTKQSYISLNKFKYFKETYFFFKTRHITSPKTLTYAFSVSIHYLSKDPNICFLYINKIIWRPPYIFLFRHLRKKIASMVKAHVHIVQTGILSLKKLKEKDDINET